MDRLIELRATFRYEPSSGDLYRLARAGRRERKIIQIDSHGHLQVKFRDKWEMAHRICWELHYGERPAIGMDIDHINRIRSDNRIENLRLATRSQNNANCGAQKNNKLGVKGVRQRGKKFQVILSRSGKCISGGVYERLEDAINAHANLHKKFHGEFSGA